MADLNALIKHGEGISCVRKLMKYGKAYGGNHPELLEDDVFRSIVKYPDFAIYEKDSTVIPQVAPQVTPSNSVAECVERGGGGLNRSLLMKKLELNDRQEIIWAHPVTFEY